MRPNKTSSTGDKKFSLYLNIIITIFNQLIINIYLTNFLYYKFLVMKIAVHIPFYNPSPERKEKPLNRNKIFF